MSAEVLKVGLWKDQAWHGDAVIWQNQDMRVLDAVKFTGIDFIIVKSQVTDILNGKPYKVPNKYHLKRLDSDGTEHPLDRIVSGRYKIAQPGNIFRAMQDVQSRTDWITSGVGALSEGRSVFAHLLISENDVGGHPKETMRKYLFLASVITSQGGGVYPIITRIRVVCKNTERMALRDSAGKRIAFPHVGDIQEDINTATWVTAAEYMTAADDYFMDQMFRSRINREQLVDLGKAVYPLPTYNNRHEDQLMAVGGANIPQKQIERLQRLAGEKKDKHERDVETALAAREDLFQGFIRFSDEYSHAGGTLYAAYNALTEKETHAGGQSPLQAVLNNAAQKRIETGRKLLKQWLN